MDERLLYQLLNIVKHNGNIWDIISEGYEFGQIAYLMDILKERGYLSVDFSGKVIVTETGNAYLSVYEANQGIQKYSKWVLPYSEMWHTPMKETEIYIPQE